MLTLWQWLWLLDWVKQQYNGTSSTIVALGNIKSFCRSLNKVWKLQLQQTPQLSPAIKAGVLIERAFEILILNFEQVSPAPSVPTSSILSCFDSSSPSSFSSESAGEGSPAPETRQYWLIPFSPLRRCMQNDCYVQWNDFPKKERKQMNLVYKGVYLYM